MQRSRVVFVCTANRFRSVMAEYILKDLLVKSPIPGVTSEDICSAGILSEDVWQMFQTFLRGHGLLPVREEYYGVPALSVTLKCLSQKGGVDVSAYRSRPLQSSLALEAKLVVTMQKLHVKETLERYPFLKGRVVSIRDLCAGIQAGGDLLLEEAYPQPLFDAEDPHFMNYGEEYTEQVYSEIRTCLEVAWPRLRELLQDRSWSSV